MTHRAERESRRPGTAFTWHLITLVSAAVLVSTPSTRAEGIMDVRATYEKATEKRGRAVTEALKQVKSFLNENPDDVVATMYQGSLYAMCAGDSFFPWKKLYFLRKGMDLMDSAMDRAESAEHHGRDPELEMLLVRAMTNAAIPRAFNRGGLARRDFARISEHHAFSALPENRRAEVLAWIARYAREDGEAERAEQAMAEARALDSTAAEAVWSGE